MSTTPKRQVVVEMTVRYVIDAPADSTPEDIHFQRNDGCWCSTNDIDMLLKMSKDTPGLDYGGHCVCFQSEIKYLREATEEDKETLGYNTLLKNTGRDTWGEKVV